MIWVNDNTIQQVGALPYLWVDDHLTFVAITSTKTGQWIFPKGQIDSMAPLWDIAEQEAFEEAGVLGTIQSQRPIATVKRFRAPYWRQIDLYPLHIHTILPTWSESHLRRRCQLPLGPLSQVLCSEYVSALYEGSQWIEQHHPE